MAAANVTTAAAEPLGRLPASRLLQQGHLSAGCQRQTAGCQCHPDCSLATCAGCERHCSLVTWPAVAASPACNAELLRNDSISPRVCPHHSSNVSCWYTDPLFMSVVSRSCLTIPMCVFTGCRFAFFFDGIMFGKTCYQPETK